MAVSESAPSAVTTAPYPSEPRPLVDETWWRDAVLLALGALLLRLPALFAPTNLGYDDGGYGLAAVAMRQGYEPFRDIFSPQGPLFLPLVHVADLLGLQTLDAPRLLSVAAGLVVTVATYAAAREVMDRGRALLAGALAAVSGVLLWTTGPLTGDGPGAALATAAVAVALAHRRSPSTVKAVVVGVLAGAAVAVKSLLVGPAVVIAGILLLTGRRRRDAVLAGVIGVGVVVLSALPWGAQHVLDDYVRYHLDKTGSRKPGANARKILTTLGRRDTLTLAVGGVGLAFAAVGLARRRRTRATGRRPRGALLDRLVAGDRVLWWWLGLTVAVLLVQDPMFRNHLAALGAPLALVAARWRPPWVVVVLAALVALPYQADQLHELLWPHEFRGQAAVVVRHLRALPDGAWALSDEPGLVWRAGKATDPFFVDPSILRIQSDVASIKITEARVLRAAGNPKMCAVVVWADVRFGSFPGLPAGLRARGYEQTARFGPHRGLYERPDCRPPPG